MAYAHVLLSIVLNPVTGVAVAMLALTQLVAWQGWRKVAALPGLAFGVLHTVSVPLTLLLPDTEVSAVFAAAAISSAAWALLTGWTGAPRPARVATTPAPAPV